MATESPAECSSPREFSHSGSATNSRPIARGKFFWRGAEKLYLRGVTYGPFRPESDGSEYHHADVVARDFSNMAAAGINAVRVYTVPPRWLLDLAEQHGLLVLVGLPWEQHVTFLDDKRRARDIEQRVRQGVRAFAGHPALLGFAVGNEIPASIVRWHGRQPIERFIRRLYDAAKSEDPGALITYVNFPTTEYLDLSFLDFACFNVYLETEERLSAYLARLQNLAGERPLVMAEVGLDSLRHGWNKQAATLDWQIRTTFARGAAGMFVFAWTDEWHRGGHDIGDWDFGLTTRAREPKPSLEAVRDAFAGTPIGASAVWPKFSVVVCSYNGARTIRDTLDHLARLEYPSFETIVVSDGSTDNTAEIARSYPGVRVIETPNGGLSAARNTGMAAATGAIIAYIDDDAYPDPHWLTYLAHAFRESDHGAIGGPNVAPAGDGPIAECVARAPGGPIHVLIGDDLAEHIPGCNFVVRKSALLAIGGFDPIYRVAGDDVDACWRLQQQGFTIGFHPAAMVWHHRRNSARAYWRQQIGYGKAEALLEQKWPERYNTAGHLNWTGRLYGAGVMRTVGLTQRIYHGTWNSAPFQSLYEPAAPLWQALPQMPEWYLVNLALAGFCALGASWRPLLWTAPLLAIGILLPLAQIVASVRKQPGKRILTAALFAIQPIARLLGRIRHGLTPWRKRMQSPPAAPFPFMRTTWSEQWRPSSDWLEQVRGHLGTSGAVTLAGGDYDGWDLEVRGGLFGRARLRVAIEEHGSGKQLLRWHAWPRVSIGWIVVCLSIVALAAGAAYDGAWVAASVLGVASAAMLFRVVAEWCGALGSIRAAVARLG